MAAFVQWLAARHDERRAVFLERVSYWRRHALSDVPHARTPEIVASLQAAFEFYLDFAVECEVLGRTERDQWAAECWEALRHSAAAQAKHHEASEPTAMFLALLRSVLTSGRAHLAMRNSGVPERPDMAGWRRSGSDRNPEGDCIGWLDGADVYLEPSAAFRQVQLAGRDTGEALPVTEQTLKRRLRERGLLASVDGRRQTVTVRRAIAGATRDVLHLRVTTIFPDGPEDSDSPKEY